VKVGEDSAIWTKPESSSTTTQKGSTTECRTIAEKGVHRVESWFRVQRLAGRTARR